jgi:L-lactate dehydrogenase complex protein LldE
MAHLSRSREMAKLSFDPVTYQFYYQCPPAEHIASADRSCLMHQHGCAERIGVPIKFIHIARF